MSAQIQDVRREAAARLSKRGETPLFGGPIWERALLLSLVFLPFQYALTIDVFFPLKISEILAAFALVAFVLSPHKPKKWDASSTLAVLLAAAILFSTVVSFTPTGIVFAQGYERALEFDILLYAGYGLFTLIFWTLLRRIDRDKSARALVLSIWTCGAAVALQWGAAITGNTQIIAALGFRTLGITGQAESLRSGPFLEGQHLGFYAGAAVILAIYRRAYFAVLVAVAMIFFSQSTTAYLGLAVAAVMILIVRPRARYAAVAGWAVTLGAAVVLLVDGLRDALGKQLAKLGFTEFAPEYRFATASLDIRSAKTSIAFEMMRDNAAFGVGPGRFGAHFGNYAGDYVLPASYSAAETRPIAENVYGHIGAELGVAALLFFGCIVLLMFIRNWNAPLPFFGLAAYLAVSVATQSSWTFLPIWAFIAVATAVTEPASGNEYSRASAVSRPQDQGASPHGSRRTRA